MTPSFRSRRVTTGGLARAWRWVAQPWQSPGLLLALVASFAFPAFMAASADVMRVSAADSITRSVAGERPAALDVDVLASGPLTAAGIAALDRELPSRLARSALLADAQHTVYTRTASPYGLARLSTSGDASEDASADDNGDGSGDGDNGDRSGDGVTDGREVIIGSGARFLAREGAVDALDVVEGDRSVPGLWISTRLAQRLDLEVGEMVAVEDSAPVPVAGVYRNLWEGERDPFWEEGVRDLLPRYSRVLNGPTFELIVLDERVLTELGLVGVARWEARAATVPDTFEQLRQHQVLVRRLERELTESPSLAAAVETFGGLGGRVPDVASETSDVVRTVDAAANELDQPITTASFGGIAIGLLVTAAGAGFAVRKRRVEVRLLRSDGDAWWRFALRSLAQFAAPAALGGVLGVAAAWAVSSSADGDIGDRTDAISLRPIALTVLVGLAVAAVVTGVTASRSLDAPRPGRTLRSGWLLLAVGVAAAAWVQVGAAGEPNRVDPLVMAFPVVGLLAGVGAGVGLAQLLLRSAPRGSSLPTPVFLAWRRVTAAEPGAVLLSAAMGVALGLIVFSNALVGALTTAADAKAAAVVGGRTQVEVTRNALPTVPAGSTAVRVQSTPTTTDDGVVAVVVVDPATFAEAVTWHPQFEGSAERLIAALEQPVDADVAAVLAGNIGLAESAGFGTSPAFTYEVVERFAAAPLVSNVYPTLYVSSDQLDAAALRFHQAQRPSEVEAETWEAEYRSPLLGMRQLLISRLAASELSGAADLVGIEFEESDVVTLAGERDSVGNRAARWSFDYVGLLAAVAGLAALGVLMFFLSERRAARELASTMASRMGLRRRDAAIAAVVELLGLVVLAFALGAGTALVLAARVFDRFEPSVRQPPDVGLDVDWPSVLLIAGGALVAVVAIALGTQWRADRRSGAEVLRAS